jgi:hypothetical protein
MTMASTDGTVHGVANVHISGDITKQWNLALLSDGYQHEELPTFASDAAGFAAKLLEIAPFFDLIDEINIFRIDVSSTESGADDPAKQKSVATFFDARFSDEPDLSRVLEIDVPTALNVLQNHLPWADAGLVIVNTLASGGSGGGVAAVSREENSHRIAFHELGHTAFGLGDEYAYLRGCKVAENHEHHPVDEPANPNVTFTTTVGEIPWRALLSSPLPALPTTTNPVPGCTDCDPTDYSHLADVVGAFEGAGTYHCGAYRPQVSCCMRDQNLDFCTVCADKITSTIMSARWP